MPFSANFQICYITYPYFIRSPVDAKANVEHECTSESYDDSHQTKQGRSLSGMFAIHHFFSNVAAELQELQT